MKVENLGDAMPVLLQVDFPKEAPFGDEMASQSKDLAESIANEPGMQWKIWTENAKTGEAGGIYLFDDLPSAEAYMAMHTDRLKARGLENIRTKFFDINEPLTRITRGPTI